MTDPREPADQQPTSDGEPTHDGAPPLQGPSQASGQPWPTQQGPVPPPAGQSWPGQQWPGQQWAGQQWAADPAYGPMVPRADQRQIPGSKRDAIWAVVLACVPCCLITQVVSIVLGVKVLRRSRGEVDHGRTLATIALCIAGLMVAGTVATWGIRLFAPEIFDRLDEPTRSQDGQLAEEGDVNSLDVQVGDCLVDLEFDPDGQTEFRSVPGVPCAEEHGFEAYHSFDLQQGRYPGLEKIDDAAIDGCLAAFKDFADISYRRSILEVTWLFPTETSWNLLRDREVLCLVTDPQGPTTGSLEGARR